MFSQQITKIGIPRVSISVVDLEIAIKGIVTCAFPENRRRSSLGRCESEGEPTKEFSRMGYVCLLSVIA